MILGTYSPKSHRFQMNPPFESLHGANLNDFVGLIKSDHRQLEDLMRSAAIYKTKANCSQLTQESSPRGRGPLEGGKELAFPKLQATIKK